MTAIGRPRIFVTQAEKQKAYRERKKQEAVLRNSSGNILTVEPEPVDGSELAILRDKVLAIGAAHERHRRMPLYGPEFDAMGFDTWNRKCHEYQDTWWTAHQAWYAAWKAAGYPDQYRVD